MDLEGGRPFLKPIMNKEETSNVMGMKRLITGAAFMLMLTLPVMAPASDKAQEGISGMGDNGTMMQGQGMQGQGMQGGQDMMKMGTRVYRGKMGHWNSEARMIDTKAQMKAAGMRA